HLLRRPPPSSTLFPYTTLFRSPVRDRWRFVPIVGWIHSYERSWLMGDLIAGVAVAALVVPKNLGYAGIAGVPLQNGLYAAAAGRSEEHTSELQSQSNLVCRLLL